MITAVKATLSALAIGLAAVASPVAAQERQRPLLMEGRETVFQRVLTRPGALRYGEPGGGVERAYPAFQPLYVYARQPGWIEVGPSSSRGPEAWVEEGSVVDWKQNIVAAFTNRAGRERQILFDSEERLKEVLQSDDVEAIQARMLGEITGGIVPPEEGIVAAEPPEFVNIVDRLYLMPILDFTQDLHPKNFEPNLLMEVASVPLRDDGRQETPAAQQFDVGIVFVFDTTSSMAPYIARTQAAMEQVVRDLQGTEVGNRVNFGVVAFRDNTSVEQALEYRTRTLLPLQRRADQTQVLATIRAATDVADVDSPGFNEDSLAGIEDAVDLTDWEQDGDPFDARIVILVTDAGPKEVGDPNARSNIGVFELQRAAQDKGVAIMSLHLKTPVPGDEQHSYAETRYRELSKFHDETFYYGIENGSPQAFEDTVKRLVTAMTDVIRVARNEQRVLSDSEAGQELVNLGLAIQLAYLGRKQGTEAPDVIEGWVSEKALTQPEKLAIEPRLLVTKNEMATMADLLSNLLTLGEQARGAEDAGTFFTQVRDVVARMAQNPDRLVNTEADTLGGALEFLEDLPYESQLMITTEERWAQSAMNRRQILDGMRQKLTQYRKWLLDPAVWTPLYDGSPDGEYVFAMPFDVLP